MKKNAKICVIIPNNLSSGVIRSQIYSRFESYKNTNIEYYSYGKLKNNSCDKLIKYGIKHLFPEIIDSTNYIYVRDIFDFLKTFFIKKITNSQATIVFDVRGLVAHESFLRHKNKGRFFILESLEKICVLSADHVTTVSKNLADYLKKKYGVESVNITPCCVPASIIRKKILGVNSESNSFTFIYIGSLSVWQSFDKVCKLFSQIKDKHRLIVVTREKEEAKKILDEYGILADIRSGDWRIVKESLDESDFGFIYRNDNLVNTTSSPVKFLEYTARGVIPIASKFVGDYSNEFFDCSYITKDNCNSLDLDKLKEKLTQTNLNRLHELTIKYSWEMQK